jgi:hypothetical protein
LQSKLETETWRKTIGVTRFSKFGMRTWVSHLVLHNYAEPNCFGLKNSKFHPLPNVRKKQFLYMKNYRSEILILNSKFCETRQLGEIIFNIKQGNRIRFFWWSFHFLWKNWFLKYKCSTQSLFVNHQSRCSI